MRRRFLITLALLPTSALADRIGPPELYKPIPKTIVPEQPCDETAPLGDTTKLVGKYMCQIGLDGKFFEPYPCEIIRSSSNAGYLRFARCDVYCNVVGTVRKKSLALTSGSIDCRNTEANVIGDFAVFDGKAKAIGGGYRLELQIEHIVERGFRSKTTKEKLVVNVCRRTWPKGFVNFNEIMEREHGKTELLRKRKM